METTAPAPNPFAGRNGADLFHGHLNLDHDHDSEDFGPETDVDMVDDVLLSPAIAAAKKLVQGKVDDDLERQRQQLSDFDDPADLDHSRDTPTPPAHEVASNAIVDPLGDSGEESEEEWNYIPGKDPKTSTSQEEDDMSSQLNPDAAEFVPVSPTRLMMLDEAIISASGYDNKTMENMQMPTELEFGTEIKKRPGDLEFTNGTTKPTDDYFMRDNFSSLPNKVKDFNVSSACPELKDSSILSFKPILDNGVSACTSESIPFDNLEAVKSFENKENMFGTNNDISSNVLETNHVFGKGDPMTTSIMGGFAPSPDAEGDDSVVPGTPKSTTVEAPVSPFNEEISSLNHCEDLEDSPADELAPSENQSSELLSSEEPQEDLASDQERPSSSGFASESTAVDHIPEDNEGYITEHRRTPPIDLSFKPIQNFSDTNPFGALQTPGSITPMEFSSVVTDVITEHGGFPVETKEDASDKVPESFNFMQDTRTSFISLRSPGVNEVPVSFDALESPVEEVHFEPLPSANTSILACELPKSPVAEINLQGSIPDIVESSIESLASHDLDTTEGFEVEETKVLKDEQETKISEEITVDTLEPAVQPVEPEMVSPTINEVVVEQVLAAFDDIKEEYEPLEEKKDSDLEIETKEMKLEFESHIAPSDNTPDELKNLDEGFEVISKEELSQESDPVTNKNESNIPSFTGGVDLLSPTKQTNPFVMDDNFSENLLDAQTEKQDSNTDFLSAIDKFSSAMGDDFLQPEKSTTLSAEKPHPVEPEATKTVAYQTLTPADEPKLEKTEAYTTGVVDDVQDILKEEPAVIPAPALELTPELTPAPTPELTPAPTPELTPAPTPELTPAAEPVSALVPTPAPAETQAPVVDEPTITKIEPVQSQVVTETLITALEEKSEVQSLATTAVPSSAGTPPPTPTPALDVDNKDDTQKTDILVAAVAAAGAVAAGTAVIAEKEVKKATTAPIKKPAVGATKKPSEAPTKAPTKTAPAKAPLAKTAPARPATTKPASTATKPATTTAGPKPAAAKPASAPAAKKPAPSSPLKPSSARPSTTAAPKPAGTAAPKPVPKQLPVNKTSAPTLKPASKPSTPTSKPTTPTTPKSPSVMKTDVVKSPPRPAVKSTLASTRPASGTAKPLGVTGEKKPLTNGDIKPLAKKPEDLLKKPLTAAAKTTTLARPTGPTTKTTPPVAKAPLLKAAPAKPGAAPQTKPKAAPAAATKQPAMPPPIKRPVPATATATKIIEKPVKEAVNKTISSKPAFNGKTNPAKPTTGVKKTDVKLNGKSVPGKPVPKKVEEVKKEEEKEVMIQEEHVTTTNGFSEEHNIEENGTMKIEDFEHVLIDGVN